MRGGWLSWVKNDYSSVLCAGRLKILTDNDAVWFAHNLSKKLLDESAGKLKEADVKKSLIGIRQALRDLGALE